MYSKVTSQLAINQMCLKDSKLDLCPTSYLEPGHCKELARPYVSPNYITIKIRANRLNDLYWTKTVSEQRVST